MRMKKLLNVRELSENEDKYKYRLDDESMEIRNLESRGPCAVAFRAQRGRY